VKLLLMIKFPVYVKLENARLQVLSGCLNVILLVCTIGHFVFFGAWEKAHKIQGTGNLQALQYQNLTKLLRFGKSKAADQFCFPGYADYWADMEGSTRYVNHSCRPSCLQVGSGEPFIPLGKAVFSETPDSMFVVTHTQVQNKQGQQHYFASSAEATIIRIEYTVGIPQVPWYQSRPSAYDWHTSQNVETSAVYENGEVWRHFGPGAAISLSLAELLHLAGFDSLDDINSLAGANFAPSATDAMAAGPMFRLSGMQIGINMDCGLRSTDTDQRKCIMSVSSTPHSWVSSASASTDGTIHANHGVRVRLHITGREYSFDVHSAFLNIASMLVYFKLPETIVFLVALYFCGMSLMYTGTLFIDASALQKKRAQWQCDCLNMKSLFLSWRL